MDLPDVRIESQTRKIGIIGGGPSGLVALKIIMDTPQYKSGLWTPTLFEERSKPGGIWVPASPTPDVPPLSPVYDSLTTNLPHISMSFTDFHFPPSTPVYPKAFAVEDYLQSYVSHFHLSTHIRLNTRVNSVLRNTSSQTWKVTVATGEIFDFDLLFVCNGHYREPRIPSIPGLDKWVDAKKAMHSAWYRHPEPGFGKVTLVIGGGPSGQDITMDLQSASKIVIHAVTGSEKSDPSPSLKLRGRVTSFLDSSTVQFEDGSTETGIDFCILATGYQFDFPFLPATIIHPDYPPSIPPLPPSIYNSTYNVFPLARHVLPMQNDFPPWSLAFIGLLIRVSPLPLVEAQVKAVLRVFDDPESMNYTEEAVDVITRYEELKSRFSPDGDVQTIAQQWHRFEPHDQFTYRDTLCRFAEASTSLQFPKTRVPDWEVKFYDEKDVLRKTWIQLEKEGKAEDLVKGVGEGGIGEWVALLERLLKLAEEQGGMKVEEQEKTKL